MLHVRKGRRVPLGAVPRAPPRRREPPPRPRRARREAVLLPPDAPLERGAHRRDRAVRLRRPLSAWQFWTDHDVELDFVFFEPFPNSLEELPDFCAGLAEAYQVNAHLLPHGVWILLRQLAAECEGHVCVQLLLEFLELLMRSGPIP